jgi:hypothetical protein
MVIPQHLFICPGRKHCLYIPDQQLFRTAAQIGGFSCRFFVFCHDEISFSINLVSTAHHPPCLFSILLHFLTFFILPGYIPLAIKVLWNPYHLYKFKQDGPMAFLL